MTRWLYRRRWSVICTFAAYGLARAAADAWLIPLPDAAMDLLSLALILLFCWLLRALRIHEGPPPNTPLDTPRVP